MTDETDKAKILASLKMDNDIIERLLNDQGAGITDVGVLQLQIKSLCDVLINEESVMDFNIAYQRNLAEAFQSLKQQILRAKLTPPRNGTLPR